MIVDPGAPSSTDLEFQNPIAPFTIKLWSQTCTTTSTYRDLYYTAAEVAEVPEIKEDECNVTTDSEVETGDHFDSDDDFDFESDEEDAQDMNMKD